MKKYTRLEEGISISYEGHTIEVYPKDAPKKMNYYDAMDYIDKLGQDYRLPTGYELKILWKNNKKIKVKSESYWSSTKDAISGAHLGYRWGRNLGTGAEGTVSRREEFNVRAVRGKVIGY